MFGHQRDHRILRYDRPACPPRQSPTLCRFVLFWSVTDTFASALPFLGRNFIFLFLIFPIEKCGIGPGRFRLISIGFGGSRWAAWVFLYVLAKYGVVGTLNLRRPIRLLVFLASVVLAAFRRISIGLCYHVDDFLSSFLLGRFDAFEVPGWANPDGNYCHGVDLSVCQ